MDDNQQTSETLTPSQSLIQPLKLIPATTRPEEVHLFPQFQPHFYSPFRENLVGHSAILLDDKPGLITFRYDPEIEDAGLLNIAITRQKKLDYFDVQMLYQRVEETPIVQFSMTAHRCRITKTVPYGPFTLLTLSYDKITIDKISEIDSNQIKNVRQSFPPLHHAAS